MNLKNQINNKPAPTIVVIFGGTGDLTKRKLLPAIYNLFLDGYLPNKFAIIGLGRTPLNNEEYQERLREGLSEFSRRGEASEEEWEQFQSFISYLPSDINDAAAYQKLKEELE